MTTEYAKNYCNRTFIVQVIVENVVTCFFSETQCLYIYTPPKSTYCCMKFLNISNNLYGYKRHKDKITNITRKPSCRWQTRATRCNVIVAP